MGGIEQQIAGRRYGTPRPLTLPAGRVPVETRPAGRTGMEHHRHEQFPAGTPQRGGEVDTIRGYVGDARMDQGIHEARPEVGLDHAVLEADPVAAELDRSLRALHPDWAQPEWIAFGARCFYTAYTREPAARS